MTIRKRLTDYLRYRKIVAWLFDAEYYQASAGRRAMPMLHFFRTGAYKGLKPHPLFDPAFYLKKYPDVAASGMNPLVHYAIRGALERRKPHPLFQPDYYTLQCPEARADPFRRFLQERGSTALNPHPLFDCAAYAAENPGARVMNPLVHYLTHGGLTKASGEGNFLEIDDVRVRVQAWRDPEGRTQVDVPPEQRPFFESLNIDQLQAQA